LPMKSGWLPLAMEVEVVQGAGAGAPQALCGPGRNRMSESVDGVDLGEAGVLDPALGQSCGCGCAFFAIAEAVNDCDGVRLSGRAFRADP